jgi:peptidoglycan/LPS O-acetylase OafA/YrhL
MISARQTDFLIGRESAMSELPARAASIRYQSLDAWRGLACLMVVVYHAVTIYTVPPSPTPSLATAVALAGRYGNHGVPIFFVISGYCIAAAIASEMRSPRGSVRRFYWRRLRRIYPPYWATIAIKVVVLAMLISVGMFPAEVLTALQPVHWISNLTLTTSFRWQLFGPERDYFLTQAWTLCYEQGFYFVSGLFLWLCFVTRKNVFFLAALAFSIVVVGLQALVAPGRTKGFFFDPHWLMFFAGIVVHWAVQRKPADRIAAIFSLVIYAALGGTAFAATAGGFAAVLIVLHPFDRMLVTSAWGRCLRLPGEACYSIYLTHTSIVVAIAIMFHRLNYSAEPNSLLVVVALCVSASLLAGWMFYYLVERRFVNTRASVAASAANTGAVSTAVL